MRFALHKWFSIAVGCRFAWRRIRWFQHSRDSLKGNGSIDSVRWAQALQELLGATHRWIVGMLALGCQQWQSHVQMELNISVAKHLWECVVSEAWSSLAWWQWWLQPRWVVEAPGLLHKIKVAADKGTWAELPAWSIYNLNFCRSDLNSFEWGSPETIHFESHCQKWSPLLFLGRSGKCEKFPRSLSVVSVTYFTSICFYSVQFSRSIAMHFCKRGWCYQSPKDVMYIDMGHLIDLDLRKVSAFPQGKLGGRW